MKKRQIKIASKNRGKRQVVDRIQEPIVGLSCRALNTLKELGVTSKEQFLKLDEFSSPIVSALRIKGCGKKTLKEVVEWAGYIEPKQLKSWESIRLEKDREYWSKRGYVIEPNRRGLTDTRSDEGGI